jgi:hypothetical protein
MPRIQHIQTWLGKKIWFLVLLPVFFLLHMVTEFYPMLQGKDLLMPVTAWFIIVPLLLYCGLRYLKPSLVKYAGFLFYLEVVFFFFTSIKTFFEAYLPAFAHYKYVLPLIGIGGVLFFFIALKRKAPPFRFFLYLNTLLIVLLAIECGQLLVKSVPSVKKAYLFNQSKNELPPLPPCDSCIKPDVYFIIFDGYAGATALKEYWNFDNSELSSFLMDRGFYYAGHSKSNYNYTPFSIGSILNMDYHQSAFRQKIDLQLYCKGIMTIENNVVCRTFQQLGYTIINQSFFPIPGDQPHQSISYLSNKPALLQSPTLYFKFKTDIGWHFNKTPAGIDEERLKNYRSSLQMIKNTYTSLRQLSATPYNRPVFVYSHIILPHDPYFFDSTGRVTPESQWTNSTNIKENYLSQLKYANILIKEIATFLQKPGNRPRVIIIQSDHGYRDFPKKMNNLEFNNLNAIYCPDGQYTGLYDSISSVNTFRFILHKYFKAPLSLLKDSTVYIRH